MSRPALDEWVRSTLANAETALNALTPDLQHAVAPQMAAFWPAWAMIALFLGLTIGFSTLIDSGMSRLAVHLVPSAGRQVRMFAGVITDTKCGASHRLAGQDPDVQCIRTCVKSDMKTKYALYDGDMVYVMADQRTAARFAARRVLVAGILDETTHTLAVRSIELVL